MRWQSGRRSNNIEDRRGSGGTRGGPGLRLGGVGLLVVIVGSYLLGLNPSEVLGVLNGGEGSLPPARSGQEPVAVGESGDSADFVASVLGDTEDTWHSIFASRGRYDEPKLVLFRGSTSSSCGQGQAAMGPFYCSADRSIYIDLSFYDDLKQRFAAPGDFAQAYVIAHEVGHHVQHLLGTSDQVHRQQRSLSKVEANALSVRLELQADCYAGIWAHHAEKARKILEEGDLEEALTAAAAIGDDRLQKQARGVVVPESFTHGSSQQRVAWFKTGFRSGALEACDTFAIREP
jgi:predicted metalloprotease